MAHELNFFKDGRARMAYVGKTPWHGLGQELTEGASIETWAKEAGMDFHIDKTEVKYTTNPTVPGERGITNAFKGKFVLYRQDTGDALSVVGNQYKVVQPIEVLEFFRNLTEDFGFQMETAGVLFNGQKYWALARVGEEAKIKGGDTIKNYVMLATSCDGSLRTVAKQTDVRVVCNNTLTLANAQGKPYEVKTSHSSKFSVEDTQRDLGILSESWKSHVEQVKALADIKLTEEQAIKFVVKVVGDAKKALEDQPGKINIAKVLQLYAGAGKGSDLKSSKGTAWGLVNAITEWSDWHKGDNQQRRLEASWFYQGDKLKTHAFAEAVKDFAL